MKRRNAMFLLSALCTAPLASIADDDQPVQAPYVEVGDCWSYRTENFDNHGPIGEYELCITYIDHAKDTILAAAKLKSDGREILTSHTPKWGTRVSVNGNITPQGASYFKFPLRVGDAYMVETEFRRALLGANTGRIKWDLKVVGWEDVAVPAGKFRAVKVEGNGTVIRYDQKLEFPIKTAIWYVPEVNRYVKYTFESPSERRGEELTGYRLNK